MVLAQRLFLCGLVTLALGSLACAEINRPWVGAVFFYWYTWDTTAEWGGWPGGVYYTPLGGYYDSRTYADNLRSLQQAADWGMTHFFMDYWAPDWKADTGEPRDLILVRAAEELRRQGYDIWMSYYQDGENFAMRDFSRNITERRDVYNWLKNYAGSEAWPRLQGLPFQMVYSRNGAPETTGENPGFHEYLLSKYGSVEAVNRAWGSNYESLDQVEFDLWTQGPARADAVDYQYSLWQEDWQAMNDAIQRELGYPGIKASFDVGYDPFRGFSYSDFARVFGGPHSYGGIFGQPHDQDAQRFIQAAVAKRYGSIFFDHLKNNYCDWNTEGRVPGAEYPPEPFHFDRFWVGNLMRYCTGVLHMSWNEWWEGSNLEPSVELGKRFCEKNLFYSTVMHHAFPSIRDFGKTARVGLLLNDWAFKCDSPVEREAYYCVQELRRSMVPFSIIPDDFVTVEELSRYDFVIAPAGGAGFGRNAAGEEIAPMLMEWARRGGRLLASKSPLFEQLLGLKRAGSTRRGADMAWYVDIGEPGDDGYILSGASFAEDWSKLPEGSYGKTESKATFRWTAGRGKTTRLLLPASPNRRLTLRFAGKAIWPNMASIFVEGSHVATIAIVDGYAAYDVAIPAEAVGSRRAVHVDIVYEQAHVPEKEDPGRFPSEKRVCNLALDWVQICTTGEPFSQDRRGPVRARVLLNGSVYGPLRGKVIRIGPRIGEPLQPGDAAVVSRYQDDQAPHSLLVRTGKGETLYVDSGLGRMGLGYVEALAGHWARQRGDAAVIGRDVTSAMLRAGDTRLLLAYNHDIRSKRGVRFSVDVGDQPVAEVLALTADGAQCRPLQFRRQGGRVIFDDALRYYGVYEVAVSPVGLQTGRMAVRVGQSSVLPVELRNVSKKVVRGALSFASTIPTMSAEDETFALQPGERSKVIIRINARSDIDPGRKTIALRVATDGGSEAYFWREITVERLPKVRVSTGVCRGDRVRLAVHNENAIEEPTASAAGVTVRVQNQEIACGDIASGRGAERSVPLYLSAGKPELINLGITVDHSASALGPRNVALHEVAVPVCPRSVAGPPGAKAAICVFRMAQDSSGPVPVVARDPALEAGRGLGLFAEGGERIAMQRTADGGICFAAPAGSGRAAMYFLSNAGGPSPATGLKTRAVNLGTGRGVLEVANEQLTLRFRESSGGVCTKFAVNATGQQYAADCFGIAYGEFSRYDPLRPAHIADQYIHEQKVEQSETAGRLNLVERGPVRAVWEATWEDENVKAVQRYELWAAMPWLKVTSRARPKNRLAAEELVLLDLRLRREPFSKIYPGFSGQILDQEKPHFGWRQVPYVHEVGSLLAPPDFENSVSLVVANHRGLNGWRQGFWPEKRPEPGPCRYARVELLRTKPGSSGATAECYILAHAGNQKQAHRFLEELKQPPAAVAVPVRQ